MLVHCQKRPAQPAALQGPQHPHRPDRPGHRRGQLSRALHPAGRRHGPGKRAGKPGRHRPDFPRPPGHAAEDPAGRRRHERRFSEHDGPFAGGNADLRQIPVCKGFHLYAHHLPERGGRPGGGGHLRLVGQRRHAAPAAPEPAGRRQRRALPHGGDGRAGGFHPGGVFQPQRHDRFCGRHLPGDRRRSV